MCAVPGIKSFCKFSQKKFCRACFVRNGREAVGGVAPPSQGGTEFYCVGVKAGVEWPQAGPGH
jgi:hypothetical protein